MSDGTVSTDPTNARLSKRKSNKEGTQQIETPAHKELKEKAKKSFAENLKSAKKAAVMKIASFKK